MTGPEPADRGRARDRDEDGRAKNARPRDRLGRPLPHGSPDGVPTMPDDLELPPLESLAEAQRLLDDGMPFHAHEVLEGTWKAAPEHERDLWQGLAQLCVGLTHVLRGNPRGAQTLLARGSRRIGGYAEAPPYGIDVAGLQRWAEDLGDAADTADPVPPRLTRP